MVIRPPFSKDERNELLFRYERISEQRDIAENNDNFILAKTFLAEEKMLKLEYFERLPRMVMSCCPFDGKPLIRSFDPFGLDGLWWDPDAATEEVPACPHFCVLVGAVNFAGNQPRAGKSEVHPGPEVPYVIPRLLDYPGMIAVISQIKMEAGYIAYPIAYFAERRPQPEELTAGWARTTYTYKTQLGVAGWKTPNDPWDFDLLPWLNAGKIKWCPPDSDRTSLSEDPTDVCPYIDLPGTRERMVVHGDKSWTAGVPIGDILPEM